MPKVSVIIPVYNTEKYLRQCLDSIINQTLKDIEIICVDDNSTDGSLAILQEYAQKDERIKILKGKGTGAGGARNVGLDVAQGEYLSFLDSDDFIELDMYEQMYQKGIDSGSDIVVCDADKYNTNDNSFFDFDKSHIPEILQDFDEIVPEKYPDKILLFFKTNVWTKIYKSNFIKENNILFQNIKIGNDMYFGAISKLQAKKIAYITKKFVHYRVGHSTNIQSNIQKSPFAFSEGLIEIYNYMIKNNLYNKYKLSFLNFSWKHITHQLNSVKTYPLTYYKLKQQIINELLPKINMNEKQLNCWSNLQIFLAWLFSIRNFRYTNYKILNILGIRIKIKRKNK